MSQWHPALVALEQRWQTFLGKVRTRVGEIEQEAQQAYRDVTAADAVDSTGLSGVSSAITARLIALRARVNDQFGTIDSELDKIELDDSKMGGYWRGQQIAAKSALLREIERRQEALTVWGEAYWARALGEVARQEMGAPLACSQCGAGIQRPTSGTAVFQATNIQCPHCGAMTTAQPGTATALFFGGTGAHLLAKEVALPEWNKMQDAEDEWNRLRHRTHADAQRWEGEQVAYWRAFGNAMTQWHAGWNAETVENEIRGKLSVWRQTTAVQDQEERGKIGSGLAAVATGEAPHVAAWVQRQADKDTSTEELMWAALERGWRDHVGWIAQIAEPIIGEQGWAQEKLADVTYYYATGG